MGVPPKFGTFAKGEVEDAIFYLGSTLRMKEKMMKRNCEQCGDEYVPYASRADQQRFCSPRCNRAWHVDRDRRAREMLKQLEAKEQEDVR